MEILDSSGNIGPFWEYQIKNFSGDIIKRFHGSIKVWWKDKIFVEILNLVGKL